MKQTLRQKLSVVLALVCIGAGFSMVSGQDWQLVWQDEFNYTGLPDANKWGYDVGNGGWGNNELQNYTANRKENARVENGTLVIEARRDWYNNIEYSSARLVTRNKGDWKYGRIEVKAKLPLGQGMWPAIWMLSTDWKYGGWPASGELDIMENFALGGIKPYSIEGNIHTQAYNHTIGTNKGATMSNLTNIEQNYHVYALNWYENKVDFEVDGKIYFTFNNEGTWQTWPFNERFHLILNIAVGGTLGTNPDPNIFPKRMTVDYVRVYQKGVVIPATTGLVTAYRDDQYKNHSIGLSVGDYKLADLKKLGMNDNDITSIKITQGYKAILYENDNFSGASKTITADNPNLGSDWNDKTSSIKIQTNGVTGLAGLYFLQNRKTGFFIDALGGTGATANGVNIQQWNFKYQTNQQLEFTHISNGCYKVLFKHSGKSLDVNGGSKTDGANVQQWEYTGVAQQQFIVVAGGDGCYKLIAKHSGKIVEVVGNNLAAGGNIQQWKNNNQENGQWRLNPVIASSTGVVTAYKDAQYKSQSIGLGVGEYKLADIKKLGMINDDISSIKVTEGYKVILYENDNFAGASKTITADNGDLGTDWSDRASSIKVLTNGVTTLAGVWSLQNRKTGFFIDATGGTSATANGVNIQQWNFKYQTNQQLEFTHISNGCYKVLFKHSGKSLDVKDGSTADGANIQQWEYTGVAQQQFIAVAGGDGCYKLIAKHSGKVVEVTGSNLAAGGNIQQWKNNNQESGQWRLNAVVATSTGLVTAYKDAQFKSQSIGLGVGEYKLADIKKLGMIDNDISSITVTEGYKATLFFDDNFAGASKTITADNADLGTEWSDKASSIRIETNGDTTLTGTWFLENKKSGLFLNVRGGVTNLDNGAVVEQSVLRGEATQKVTFEHLGNGAYKVVFGHSGKVLDVSAVSQDDGAKIQQWEYTGSANQQFIVLNTDDGYFKLIAKHSGKLVDGADTGLTEGSPLLQFANSNQESGMWRLTDTNTTPVTPVVKSMHIAGIQSLNRQHIRFTVPVDGIYTIELLGLNGRTIDKIESSFFRAGSNLVKWNNIRVADGMAIAVLRGEKTRVVVKSPLK